MESNLISNIKKDFSFLKNKVKDGKIDAILLYGSYAKNQQTIRSDIDICIVGHKLKTIDHFSKLLLNIWSKINANKYDVRIFESLTLYIQIDIIKNHKVIFAKNIPDLSYYFYKFRKLWQDQSVNWIEV